MSAYWGTEDEVTEVGLSLDFDSAASVVFTPGRPVDVKAIIIVLLEATSVAASAVTVARRNADDSSSTTLGTFSLASGLAVNTVHRVTIANVKTAATGTDASQVADVNIGGRVLGIQTNDPGVARVNPGQEIVVTSDGAGTGGNALVFFEYVEVGNQEDGFTINDITFTHA